jgi:hypothetical protein
MAKSVTVSYTLRCPPGVVTHDLSTTPTMQFPVMQGGAGLKERYASLSGAINECREALGRDLTAWRDAVGNKEMGKETKKSEEEEEGEEEA